MVLNVDNEFERVQYAMFISSWTAKHFHSRYHWPAKTNIL